MGDDVDVGFKEVATETLASASTVDVAGAVAALRQSSYSPSTVGVWTDERDGLVGMILTSAIWHRNE